jgi:hypothetical protein
MMVLPKDRIVTVNITGGDGAKSGTGVFVFRLDVLPRAQDGLPPNMVP